MFRALHYGTVAERIGMALWRVTHDASDAAADRQRRADHGLQYRRYGDARQRQVDDEAAMHTAVGQRQRCMGAGGNETRMLTRIEQSGIALLFFQPDKLVG